MIQDAVTLGVPCRDAAATVSHVLAAVEAQTERPQQLVCVDDFSDDDTPILLEERASTAVHRHHRRRGPAATRNAILDAAETEFVAIVDDDVTVASDWLETLLGTIEETGAAMVGGTVSESAETRAGRWRALRAPHDPYEESGSVPWVDGSAILARTEALRSVGGWPEGPPEGGFLDGEWPGAQESLCARLRAAGETVYYDADAEATHLGEETPAAALRARWRADLDETGDALDAATDVFRRFGTHLATAGGYVAEDVRARRWWALPITLRLPFAHALQDVRQFRAADGPGDAAADSSTETPDDEADDGSTDGRGDVDDSVRE